MTHTTALCAACYCAPCNLQPPVHLFYTQNLDNDSSCCCFVTVTTARANAVVTAATSSARHAAPASATTIVAGLQVAARLLPAQGRVCPCHPPSSSHGQLDIVLPSHALSQASASLGGNHLGRLAAADHCKRRVQAAQGRTAVQHPQQLHGIPSSAELCIWDL
jgi:hypothetical protein